MTRDEACAQIAAVVGAISFILSAMAFGSAVGLLIIGG